MIARRAATTVVAACLLSGACGKPLRAHTIARDSNLARLRPACAAIDETVRAQLHGTVSGMDANPPRLAVTDGQCAWARASQPPSVVVGIISGGESRLHETHDLLHNDTVSGIGDGALYAPDSRTLFTVHDGRLWYAQLIGDAPPGSDAKRVTIAIATALVRASATS